MIEESGNQRLIKYSESTTKEETQKPTMEATDRFANVVLPKSGKVQQFDLKTITSVQKMKVTSSPYRIAILGMELNKKGDE